jgi:hypothetical protein
MYLKATLPYRLLLLLVQQETYQSFQRQVNVIPGKHSSVNLHKTAILGQRTS